MPWSTFLRFVLCFSAFQLGNALIAQDAPNILLIIADDLGVDISNGYHEADMMPTTPTLDSLRSVGLTFENVFAYPVCTPSRAAIMSGKWGVKTGVTTVPGDLGLEHTTLFDALENQDGQQYSDALIGKWHLTQPLEPNDPIEFGADYYLGALRGGVDDYYAWEMVENGTSQLETTYVTTKLTDASIDWIADQDQPWFLWLAHMAPHSPYHVPPADLYTITSTTGNLRKYIAMIEAMDHELNRLFQSMSEEEKANTLVIYVGDNGTPNNVLQDYPSGHSKGSLYQGGVRVPMIVSGAGVTRAGERESALVNIADIHATILEVAGADLPGGIYNSLSFKHLLSGTDGPTRDYNYMELTSQNAYGWTIRNNQYKLIDHEANGQEMYDLLADSFEINNLLLGTLTTDQIMVKADLEAEASRIQTDWSCRDYIQNGDETDIDCGTQDCGNCEPNGIGEITVADLISVSPNPTDGLLKITADGELIESVAVYDIVGKLLLRSEENATGEVTFDLHKVTPQLLFVVVRVAGNRYVKRVIKE